MASRSLYRSSLSALERCCRSWAKGQTFSVAMRKQFAPATGCNLIVLPHEHPHVQNTMGPDEDEDEDDTFLEHDDEAVIVLSETIHEFEAVLDAVARSSNTDDAAAIYQTLVRSSIRPLFAGKPPSGDNREDKHTALKWWKDHEVMGFVIKFAELVPSGDPSAGNFSPSLDCPLALLQYYQIGCNLNTGFNFLRLLNEYTHTIDALERSGFFDVKKQRPEVVDFCVGDVISHRIFGPGVVISWDETCLAHPMWIEQNKIHTVLSKGTAQPFYSVLLADGTERYVSQENISLKDRPEPVTGNSNLPFYFTGFDDEIGAYVPNSYLQRLFPADADARGQLVGVGSAAAAAAGASQYEATGDGSAAYDFTQWTSDSIAKAGEAELLGLLKTVTKDVFNTEAFENQYGSVAGRLWQLWNLEKGPAAAEQLQVGVEAMNNNDFGAAQDTFDALVAEHPSWAEALNKQATLAYRRHDFSLSARLCHRVLALKPAHFGAIDGLIKCSVELEDWVSAREFLATSRKLMPASNHYPDLQEKLSMMEREGVLERSSSEDAP